MSIPKYAEYISGYYRDVSYICVLIAGISATGCQGISWGNGGSKMQIELKGTRSVLHTAKSH